MQKSNLMKPKHKLGKDDYDRMRLSEHPIEAIL